MRAVLTRADEWLSVALVQQNFAVIERQIEPFPLAVAKILSCKELLTKYIFTVLCSVSFPSQSMRSLPPSDALIVDRPQTEQPRVENSSAAADAIRKSWRTLLTLVVAGAGSVAGVRIMHEANLTPSVAMRNWEADERDPSILATQFLNIYTSDILDALYTYVQTKGILSHSQAGNWELNKFEFDAGWGNEKKVKNIPPRSVTEHAAWLSRVTQQDPKIVALHEALVQMSLCSHGYGDPSKYVAAKEEILRCIADLR